MKEVIRIVAPKMEVPPILRDVKLLKIPRSPRYYKKKVKQMRRDLI